MPAEVWIGISREEFRRFEEALGRLVRVQGVSVTTVVFKVMFDLLRDIIRATPVDTGRARAAWTVWYEERGLPVPPVGGTGAGVAEGMQDGFARSNLPTEGAIPTSLKARAEADKPYTEITNAVRYILPLEFGWSRQARSGMVRKEVIRHAKHFLARLKRGA